MAALSETSESLDVHTLDDVVRARQLARRWAGELGFSVVKTTKLVTAASELARNLVEYGGGGTMAVELAAAGPKRGLRAVFRDHGPGIPDIEMAMKDHYTTGTGLGLGLGGARRLVDEFELVSLQGEGVSVTIAMWV